MQLGCSANPIHRENINFFFKFFFFTSKSFFSTIYKQLNMKPKSVKLAKLTYGSVEILVWMKPED